MDIGQPLREVEFEPIPMEDAPEEAPVNPVLPQQEPVPV